MQRPRFTSRQASERLRRFRRDDRAIILILTALIFPVLLAFMGLALDMGSIYDVKRRQQKAADAGAIGGAHEILRGRPNLVTLGARNDASMNGFVHYELSGGDPDVTVTVTYPYTYNGSTDFVEVLIEERNVPTYFLGVVGTGTTTVQSRAVAGAVKGYDGCVLALNPTASDALTVVGNGVLNANCGIMVNSTDGNAIDTTANACLNSSTWIGTAGVAGIGGPCVSPVPTNYALAMLDPLAGTPPPPIPATPYASGVRINAADCNSESQNPQFVGTWPPFSCGAGGVYTWPPGRYDDFFQIQGGTHVFQAGVYVLNSGLKITGNGTAVTGTEVGFYNTDLGTGYNWKAIDIGAGVTGSLTAPTTGPMKGILFWVDGDQPLIPAGNHIIGHSTMVFTGTIYMPSQHLDYGGSSNAAGEWTYIIADTIDVHGAASVNQIVGPDAQNPGTPDVFKVTLVE